MNFIGPNLWVSLHAVAFYYDPRDATTFRNWIGTISILIPCRKCRQHMRQNLRTYPLTDHDLASSANLFKWTYKLHDHVNVQLGKSQRPSLANAIHFYQQYPLSKIGRAFWNTLHSLAIYLQPTQRAVYSRFVRYLFDLLPSAQWRRNIDIVERSLPLFTHISGLQIFMWSVMLHNRINYIIGKREVSFRDAALAYVNALKLSVNNNNNNELS